MSMLFKLISADVDFVRVSNDTVAVGSSPFFYSYNLLDDIFDEPVEMFNLVLSAGPDASIAPGSGTATITINDGT